MPHFFRQHPSLFFLLLLICKCASSEDTVVVTSSGPIKGKQVPTGSGAVTAFLGIPYAEPPVKNLRFQKPLPRKPWGDVLEATSFGNSCPQAKFPGLPDEAIWASSASISEDCLFLNIWVPHPQPSTPLPVLVWFQGLGFIIGAASLDIYNGATLSATENVIVVSMNYRLGALGFLYLPPAAPGNLGLWDQHLALTWLKENIAVLGGDPAQLTLVGQSAGAALVGCHLLSPASQPLFARAVLQSGVPNAIWPWKSPKEAKADAVMLSNLVGCANEDPGAVIRCLQEIDIGDEKFSHLTTINSLTIDGEFLPDKLPKLLDSAVRQGKPILTGITADEGSLFTLLMYQSTKTNGGMLTWRELLQGVNGTMQRGTEEDVATSVALKFSEVSQGPGKYRLALSHYMRDYFFVCPLTELAAKLRKAGKPVYVYSFDHHVSGSAWPEWVGTPHGAEIPYLFGTMATGLQANQSITAAEEALSRRMMRYWAEFARRGNPTRLMSNEMPWPLYDATEQNFFHISTEAPQLKRLSPVPLCDFLATLPKKFLEDMDSEFGKKV